MHRWGGEGGHCPHPGARGHGTQKRVPEKVTAVTMTTTRATKSELGQRGPCSTRAMTKPSPREEGADGPPRAARVHNNQLLRRQQRQGQVTTASSEMTKAARAMVTGATRTTAITAAMATMAATVTTAATMMPNKDETTRTATAKATTKQR
jgi:hypothetical protein